MALQWFKIKNETWHTKAEPGGYTYRARVPGGWLVSVWAGTPKKQELGGGVTFVPDPQEIWQEEHEEG